VGASHRKNSLLVERPRSIRKVGQAFGGKTYVLLREGFFLHFQLSEALVLLRGGSFARRGFHLPFPRGGKNYSGIYLCVRSVIAGGTGKGAGRKKKSVPTEGKSLSQCDSLAQLKNKKTTLDQKKKEGIAKGARTKASAGSPAGGRKSRRKHRF